MSSPDKKQRSMKFHYGIFVLVEAFRIDAGNFTLK